MKNLFNNISREEKNRILEMHSVKNNVISEQSGTPVIPKDFVCLHREMGTLYPYLIKKGTQLKFSKDGAEIPADWGHLPRNIKYDAMSPESVNKINLTPNQIVGPLTPDSVWFSCEVFNGRNVGIETFQEHRDSIELESFLRKFCKSTKK
jgi:hypothetical protein